MKGYAKKFLSVLLIMVMIGAVAGCGNNGGDEGNSPETSKQTESQETKTDGESTSEPIVLEVWLPANNENENIALSEMMDAYNESMEGKVVVEYEFVPRANQFAYEDKISAAVTINQLPDLLMMDGPNVSNYAYSKIIQPLDDYIEEGDLNDFVGSVIDQGTYDGQFYALAPSESDVALFFNKDIIDSVGIDPPMSFEEAWTFEEFHAAVEACHVEGEVNGLNICPDYGTGEWMTYFPSFFVWANGGEIISSDGTESDGYINSQATIESMEYFQSLAQYADWQATPTEFEEGRAAFKISGSWVVPGFEANYPDLNWGVTYLPYAVQQVAPSGDWAWGVSSTDNVEASVDFMLYMNNAENIQKFQDVSGNRHPGCLYWNPLNTGELIRRAS